MAIFRENAAERLRVHGARQPRSRPRRQMGMNLHRLLCLILLCGVGVLAAQSAGDDGAKPLRIRALNAKGQVIGSAWATPVGDGYVMPRDVLAGATRAELAGDERTEIVNAVRGDDPEHNLIVVATGMAPAHTLTAAAEPREEPGSWRIDCGPDAVFPVREPRVRDLPVFGSVYLGRTAHGDAIGGCPLRDEAGSWQGIVVWESPMARPSMAAVPAALAESLSHTEERSWEEWRSQQEAEGVRFRNSLLLEGLQDLWRENHSGAIRSLSELLEARPGDARAWYYRGYAKAMSGDRPGAIEDYEESVSLDPSNADVHFSLGFSYLLLKRKLEAMEQVKELEKVDAEMAARLRMLIGAVSEGERPAEDDGEAAPPAEP